MAGSSGTDSDRVSTSGRIDLASTTLEETKVAWLTPSRPQRTCRSAPVGAKLEPWIVTAVATEWWP
eukprot:4055500-Pleurochrysis_carterae.AAC.7